MNEHSHNGTPVASGQLVRPRYFPRQVVTAADLTADQDATIARQRRRNRLLLGFGVVCGLNVTYVYDDDGKKLLEVLVSPGFAVSPNGDEIHLGANRQVDISCCIGEECAPEGDQPLQDEIFIVIRYKEDPTSPVAALPDRCASKPTCEHARWREDAEVVCVADLPPVYANPDDCEDHLGRIRNGDIPACATDRGDDVVLARVTIIRAGDLAPEPMIDFNPRRELFSSAAVQEAVRCLEARPSGSGYAPGLLDPDVGVNGMIQSTLKRANVDDQQGDFEVVVRQGTVLTHYWHASNDDSVPWTLGQQISAAATGPASIIQSTYGDSDKPGNFELVVPEGSNLVHYWFNNSAPYDWFDPTSADNEARWVAAATVSTQATGPASLIQSTLKRRDETERGDFEVLVPEAGKLQHYWWNPSDPQPAGPNVWEPLGVLPSESTGPGCLIQSKVKRDPNVNDAPTFADEGGDFEVIAIEGSDLVHYWRNSTDGEGVHNDTLVWHRAHVITASATGPGSLIQGRFRRDDSGNIIASNTADGDFEVVVMEGKHLVHFILDPYSANRTWYRAHSWDITAATTGPATLSDTTVTFNDLPSFALAVPERSSLAMYWRQHEDPTRPWQRFRSWDVIREDNPTAIPSDSTLQFGIKSVSPPNDASLEIFAPIPQPIRVTVTFTRPVDPNTVRLGRLASGATFEVTNRSAGFTEIPGTLTLDASNSRARFTSNQSQQEMRVRVRLSDITDTTGVAIEVNESDDDDSWYAWRFEFVDRVLIDRGDVGPNILDLRNPRATLQPIISAVSDDPDPAVAIPMSAPVELDHLPGLSTTLARKLRAAGITDVATLAEMEPAMLVRILGVTPAQAMGFVWAARQRPGTE